MAVECEFIDVIVPIKNIDKVWTGGFKAYRLEYEEAFGLRLWHDEHLLRDGAMSPEGIAIIVEDWEEKGLEGVVEVDNKKQWKDLCVVESMFGGPTYPCDWLVLDDKDRCVYYKGTPKGKIIGRDWEKMKRVSSKL